jgi:esterase
VDAILNHEQVTAGSGAEPERWIYMLHGIYGAGRNWGTIARRVVRERDDWGAVLVDLRQHGASQGFPPPHTIAAAAQDVVRLATSTGLPLTALLGHSFGGKVALAVAAAGQPQLRQLWMIDSTPEARKPTGSAWRMLQVLRALPARFATRDELMAALEKEGFAHAVAQWMATNLEAANGDYTWRFDLDSLEALLVDFFATDLMGVVEAPPDGLDLRIVRATRASVLDGNTLERIEAAAAAGRLHLEQVEGGHWLNADNPDALVSLLVHNLP